MLIIAHRLTTIKDCDKIIVLDNGEVLEQGTHEHLLEKQGKYYKLWNMQQGNIKIKEDETEDLLQQILLQSEDDEDDITYK